jgi:anti-sigma regulatory factor (Ser/Thr protein kinase)
MSECGPTSDSPVRLCRAGAADAVTAARLRRDLRRWLQGVPELSAETRDDIILGVNEALANCVEHAYHGQHAVGTMRIQASHDPEAQSISVRVSDRGRWHRPPPTKPDDPRSSRGIALMRALAERCTIEGRAGGTMVRMDYPYDVVRRHSYAG